MGPTWVLSAPDGAHDGPMNFAIRDCKGCATYIFSILFPGGGVSLNTSEYAKAGQKLYDMAVEVWGRAIWFPPFSLWTTKYHYLDLPKATIMVYVIEQYNDRVLL